MHVFKNTFSFLELSVVLGTGHNGMWTLQYTRAKARWQGWILYNQCRSPGIWARMALKTENGRETLTFSSVPRPQGSTFSSVTRPQGSTFSVPRPQGSTFSSVPRPQGSTFSVPRPQGSPSHQSLDPRVPPSPYLDPRVHLLISH